MPFRQLIAVSLLIMTASCASALAPRVNAEPEALREGGYALDRDHAALLFKVGHLGFSKYVGRFNEFDVTLDFDEQDPTTARVNAIIDMTSLDVADDDFSEKLKGPGWFDAGAYPQATFRSRSIEITGENEGVLTGDFTMRGITQPITMDVTFNGGGYDVIRGAYVLGLSATTKIKRSEYGVKKFRPLVRDTVEIEIEAEFLRQGEPGDGQEIAIAPIKTAPSTGE